MNQLEQKIDEELANLKVVMSDIASQQNDINIRRSRTEGRIYEIEWCIEEVMGKVEDEKCAKDLM
jgi:hypothetical protein